MYLNSTVYEITLTHNGHKHVVESLCLEMTDVTLIKAIKCAMNSLNSLGLKGSIHYDSHKERSLIPEL